MHRLLLGFLLLAGCQKPVQKIPPHTTQEFTGREELGEIRRPLYRAKVPREWVRHDPSGALHDTTLPNVTFLIDDRLKVTLHTFPSDSLEERISPFAQVERWKRQAGEGRVEPISHGGFVGLFFAGTGVVAWSMQLDWEHYQTLGSLATNRLEEGHFKQMRADYTIKATGPQELMDKHRDDILFFAKSFALIQEIPKRL